MLQGTGGELRAKIVESVEHQIAKVVFCSNTGKRWPEMETLLLELGADSPTADRGGQDHLRLDHRRPGCARRSLTAGFDFEWTTHLRSGHGAVGLTALV